MSYMKKFVIHLASMDSIPPGGNVVDGVRWLASNERRSASFKKAQAKARELIDAVKSAPGDNPYGDDDESIAKAIMEKIDQRQDEQRRKRMEQNGHYQGVSHRGELVVVDTRTGEVRK